MPKQKRALVEGDNDGEGYPWKVLKSKSGKAIHVFHGKGGDCTFRLNKEDKKAAPTAGLVLQRIGEHRQEKRKQAEGGGGKKAKASRLSAEAASLASEAESSMKPAGSKEERRVQTEFPHLHTPGRPERNYDDERRSEAENREHRRMVEGFQQIQKVVDEEMDEDGSDMCHILKLLAMAIFSQHGGPATTSSPEEKLGFVADLVSAELQGMMKQHGAKEGLLVQMDEGKAVVDEEQQQEDEEEEEEAVAVGRQPGPARSGARSSFFNRQLTNREYASRRATLLFAPMDAHEKEERLQRLQSEVRRQQKPHEQCREELKRKDQLIKELRLRIPGQGLGAWLTGPTRPPQLVFPQATRSRILRELKGSMSLRVGADPLKLQWLVKQLHDAFGHATDEEVRAARAQPKLSLAKDQLWAAVADATAIIKTTNGRPTNHARAVRQVLLPILAHVAPELRSVVAQSMSVSVQDLKANSGALAQLKSGELELWFTLRGKVRSSGRFGKTPAAICEAAHQHWEDTTTPSANKKDVVASPEDDKDKHVAHFNYEQYEDKQAAFQAKMRQKKLDEQAAAAPGILAAASPGDVLVTSLMRTKAPFTRLLRLKEGFMSPVKPGELESPPDLEKEYSGLVDESDGFIRGHVVRQPDEGNRRLLEETEEWSHAPLKSIAGALPPASALPAPAAAAAAGGAAPPPPRQRWRVPRPQLGIYDVLCMLFTMGMGVFLACMPFFIKKGCRQTCLCVYHLRFEFMIEGLRRYFTKHGEGSDGAAGGGMGDGDGGSDGGEESSSLSVKEFLKQPDTARAAWVCEKDDSGYYRPECLDGSCGKCGSFKLIQSRLEGTGLLPDGPLEGLVAGGGAGDGVGSGMDEPEAAAGGAGGGEPIDDDEDEEEQAGAGGNESNEGKAGYITYDRWEKAEYLKKNGEKKSKYDFVTVTVPLAEFWQDFVNYWSLFLNHHDLAKWNDEAWQLLKKELQPGNVALVMDASEAHKHQLRREHQSAYFAQVTSMLWVVVLRIRVEDLGNISEEERAKLLNHFETLEMPPIIRETHFYITGDKDKDQGQVQYILTDQANYLRARGRWSYAGSCYKCGRRGEGGECDSCGSCRSYYDQGGLSEAEKAEKGYYEGRAAPKDKGEGVDGGTFKWIHSFSDGCAAQFKCAAFLLFLSLFFTRFLLKITWNWFCSAHGKCDCDPEGGSFKHKATAHENKDDPNAASRKTIRTPKALTDFGRGSCSSTTQDFYSKNGGGVYRRFYHHVPMKGSGSISRFRRLVRSCNSTLIESQSRAKRLISKLHRAINNGYDHHLMVSERPCYRTSCACKGMNYLQCTTSTKTKCVQIELDPASDNRTPAPTSGALAGAAYRIAEEAVEGELMAMETESDETVYWVVQATKTSATAAPAPAPAQYKCPKLGSDIAFDYGRPTASNRPNCIEVKRLKPVTTRRGQDSVRLLEVDNKTPAFLVPTKLLRAGKLKLKKIETQGRASRSGPAAVRVQFELTREQRTELELQCRVY